MDSHSLIRALLDDVTVGMFTCIVVIFLWWVFFYREEDRSMKLVKNKAGNWVMHVNDTELKKLDDAAGVLMGVARMEDNEHREATLDLVKRIDVKRQSLQQKIVPVDGAPTIPGLE